jgi:hypothetical protein
MNNKQKYLMGLFVPYGVIMLTAMVLFPGHELLKYPQVAGMAALGVFVLFLKKATWIYRWMVVGFFVMLCGDIAFVFFHNNIFGIGLYLVSYLFVIAALHKKPKFDRLELLAFLGILAIYGVVAVHLLIPNLSTELLIAAMIFGVVLSLMSWTGFMSPRRHFFVRSVAFLFAIGAGFILVSDVAVAYLIFYPGFTGYILWLELLVRATFMAGWLAFALALSGKTLTTDQESLVSKVKSEGGQ